MRVASFEHAEWIDPWRDRRPMTEDSVLVTFFANGKMYVDTGSYVKSDVGFVRTALSGEGWRAPGTVLAWMPLPEPYDPTAEEEEKPFADAVTVALYPMDKEAGYEN